MTKHILITGATSGIGKQLTLDYLAEGQVVYAVGRNPQVLAELTDKGARAISVDLICRDAVMGAFSELPQLDLVVCCAGVCEYMEMPQFDSDVFMRVMDSNVATLAHTINAVLPQLKTSQGRIVAVGSASALVPFPRAEAYASSKSAVHYLMKTLQISLKPHNVAVSLVIPGFVDTPMIKKNTFEMPHLQTVEQASQAIRTGIDKQQSIIEFPKRLTTPLKFFSILPQGVWQSVLKKLCK